MATTTRTVETYDGKGKLIATEQVTITTTPEQDNDQTIRTQAEAALVTNKTYIARTSPTAAQQTAQVKALSQQMNGLIRLVLGRLDGTD